MPVCLRARTKGICCVRRKKPRPRSLGFTFDLKAPAQSQCGTNQSVSCRCWCCCGVGCFRSWGCALSWWSCCWIHRSGFSWSCDLWCRCISSRLLRTLRATSQSQCRCDNDECKEIPDHVLSPINAVVPWSYRTILTAAKRFQRKNSAGSSGCTSDSTSWESRASKGLSRIGQPSMSQRRQYTRRQGSTCSRSSLGCG